jgi:hypothetical protein
VLDVLYPLILGWTKVVAVAEMRATTSSDMHISVNIAWDGWVRRVSGDLIVPQCEWQVDIHPGVDEPVFWC